jgi:AcrR family transcriptional regulator
MAMRTRPRRPPSGSQERADRTRTAVIDETVRCVLDEGFAAPSVRHITARAGLTWGVVQYHFGDLNGLLMAVIDQGFTELTDTLDNLPPWRPDMNTVQRTELAVGAVWDAFSSPTSRAALEILVSTRGLRDEVATTHLAGVMRKLSALGRRLGEGLTAPHAVEIGNLIWATLRGILVAQMVSPQPLDTSRDRRALVKVIAAYIDSSAIDS